MKNASEILKLCEEDVRSGHAERVAVRLSQLSLNQIPREVRWPLANVCRRASLLTLGLKILSPVVRGDQPATAREKAEYAVLLQRSGSVKEALGLLKEVDAAQAPDASLFTAFCHFNRWDYALAVPVLRQYLSRALSPYQDLVGRVNLAAALLVTRETEEAETLLLRSLSDAKSIGATRLEGNLRELFAQLLLIKKDFASAEEQLETASQLFGNEQTLDQLFVQKWRAILESHRTGHATSLERFRENAVRFGDQESVREADLYLVKVKFETERFHHLYFGSPLAGYRARIGRELALAPLPPSYRFGDSTANHALDLSTGDLTFGPGTKEQLKNGKKIHQVLEVLLRDFYRPLSIGALFAELFPDEYFDIYSSPGRVHQILRRARAWLKSSAIPVEILEKNGCYRIHVTGSFAFIVPLEKNGVDLHAASLAKLLQLGHLSFQASDVRESLNMSATSFRRFADWAMEQGYLVRIGQSRQTRYQICAPDSSVSRSAQLRAS